MYSTQKLPWQLGLPSAKEDSFGRLRASSPKTFFNSDFEYDLNPLWFVSSAVGTGAIAKTAGESSATLTTGGTASGAGITYQTKQYFRYEPGKGRFVVFSGVIGAQKLNVVSRLGNFDANNGVLFEMDGALGISVIQRSNTSGSAVNSRITQAGWNIDRFDGSGPSGVVLDFSKTQLFWIDFQWMGTGHTRFGFFVDGYMMACHEIFNNNVIASPYTNTAALPLRAEVFNTGISSSATILKWICCSLTNEGSAEIAPSFIKFSANNGFTLPSAGNGLKLPLLSIQPKLLFAGQPNRVHILLERLKVFANSGSCFYQLVYNGVLTGAAFASVDPNSSVNVDRSATVITGGTIIASGYSDAGASSVVEELLDKAVPPFTLDFAGATPDTYTVTGTGIGAASKCGADIAWIELR
jgi:hypothetical protein